MRCVKPGHADGPLVSSPEQVNQLPVSLSEQVNRLPVSSPKQNQFPEGEGEGEGEREGEE